MKIKLTENKNEIKVGHILRASWGYSMSINDFYHVVGKRGKTILVVEKLQNKKLSGGGFSGQEVPDLQAEPTQKLEIRLARGRTDIAKVNSNYAKICNPETPVYYNTMD